MTKGVGEGEEEREGKGEKVYQPFWRKGDGVKKRMLAKNDIGGKGCECVCPPKPIKKPFLSRLIKQAHILSGPPPPPLPPATITHSADEGGGTGEEEERA